MTKTHRSKLWPHFKPVEGKKILQVCTLWRNCAQRKKVEAFSELLLPHGRSFSDRAFTASGNSSTEPLYGDLCPRGAPDKEVYL